MPSTESTASFSFLSVLSMRGGHAHHGATTMDQPNDAVDDFQAHVTALFVSLASEADSEILSLSWLCKLLDSFLLCFGEFCAVLFANRSALTMPPLKRQVEDFFDRAIKSLDVCNAVRDGVGEIRQFRQLLDIVIAALGSCDVHPGEAQINRSRKALMDLTAMILRGKDASRLPNAPRRYRSFGRAGEGNSPSSSSRGAMASGNPMRSLSWSVSRNWSAAREIAAIAANLSPPRMQEIAATQGFAQTVYTMSSVLFFTMWALVAAIPCQDRRLMAHISVPKTFPWAAPMATLQERIMEHSKKSEHRSGIGLLKELLLLEKSVHIVMETLDGMAPGADLMPRVEELKAVRDALRGDLDLFERQVRDVFRRIIRSRTEALDFAPPSHGSAQLS